MIQPLPEAFQFSLVGRAQTSFGKPQMLAEQFSLDGLDALSAYAAGTFSVDQGATMRAELSRPVAIALPAAATSLALAPYIFGAGGWGQLAMPTVVQQKSIDAGSAGIGIRTDANAMGTPWDGTLALEWAAKFSDAPAEREGYRINLLASFRF